MLTTLCRQSPKYGVILWEEYGMLGTSLVESGSLLAHVDLTHILFSFRHCNSLFFHDFSCNHKAQFCNATGTHDYEKLASTFSANICTLFADPDVPASPHASLLRSASTTTTTTTCIF
jgi:hypothetical protein